MVLLEIKRELLKIQEFLTKRFHDLDFKDESFKEKRTALLLANEAIDKELRTLKRISRGE